VAGFLRGVERACRDCAEHGRKLIEDKLSFWKTWRLLWTRAQWQHDFQHEVETKLRETVQPQVENAVQLLETDLRSLWPQLQDTIEAQFASEGKNRVSKTIPDFARQRRELLQSIELTLVERIAGKSVEEQLAHTFAQSAAWLRPAAGVAAAGGIATLVAAMISASVADVTGIVATSALVLGTFVAFGQRRKVLNAYEKEMETKRVELIAAIEQQMEHAIDLFYKEISTAFQPLATFCTTERKRYQPLLQHVEELKETCADLKTRLGSG
jgi:polyribonucleotide nucleotidyltransferase